MSEKSAIIVLYVLMAVVFVLSLNTQFKTKEIDNYIGELSKNFFLTGEYQNRVLLYNDKVEEYNRAIRENDKKKLQQ